jgi:hypothetical protein
MKINSIQLISLLTIFFSLTFVNLSAQNESAPQPSRYIYDESKLLTKYKNILKQQKDLPDSTKEFVKDKIDSLERIEDKKITRVLKSINKASHFEIDQYYTNKNVSSGRDIGITGYALTQSIAYKNRFGFYTRVSFYEYPEETAIKKKIPEWDLSFGYKKRFGDNLYLYTSYSHSFILYGNTESRSLLINRVSMSSYYDLDFLFLGASYTYSWGGTDKTPVIEQSASQLSLSIDRDFSYNHFLGSYYFSIYPQLSFGFGSDNFVQLRKRSLLQEKKKATAKDLVMQNIFFGFLAFDASVDFTYTIKNFDFYVSPHFAVPFNVLDDNYKRNPSAGTPIFYTSLGVTYRFKIWQPKEHRTHH